MHTKFWLEKSENFKEEDHLKDVVVDRRIISTGIFKKMDDRGRTGFNCLGISSVSCFCDLGNEPSSSIKDK
jgi:hypothetical protein